MSVRVTTGARLHFGFRNLSLERPRLYGGVGVALSNPRVTLEIDPHRTVRCDDETVEPYVARAVDYLDVPGAAVSVVESPRRHVGLGSGTQLAMAAFVGIGHAYGLSTDVRAAAPTLGRGGRSGIGVAGFERGGILLDEGHPAERFASGRPERGSWTVPSLQARWTTPEEWRFVIVVPECPRGTSGEAEETSMRTVVERAEPDVAAEIDRLLDERVPAALAANDREAFGRAVATIDRLNGTWYADEQGGVYRPPVGTIVESLAESDAVSGAGQSSWGPAVYGVTDVDAEFEARRAGEKALAAAGVDGDVLVVEPRNEGATVEQTTVARA